MPAPGSRRGARWPLSSTSAVSPAASMRSRLRAELAAPRTRCGRLVVVETQPRRGRTLYARSSGHAPGRQRQRVEVVQLRVDLGRRVVERRGQADVARRPGEVVDLGVAGFARPGSGPACRPGSRTAIRRASSSGRLLLVELPEARRAPSPRSTASPVRLPRARRPRAAPADVQCFSLPGSSWPNAARMSQPRRNIDGVHAAQRLLDLHRARRRLAGAGAPSASSGAPSGAQGVTVMFGSPSSMLKLLGSQLVGRDHSPPRAVPGAAGAAEAVAVPRRWQSAAAWSARLPFLTPASRRRRSAWPCRGRRSLRRPRCGPR